MVNQYVRLKTIGQGSHGKVWLCYQPSLRRRAGGDGDDDDPIPEAVSGGEGLGRKQSSRSNGKTGISWDDDEFDENAVEYCAIKSVAREGTGKGKSLRLAKGRRATGSQGIGADDKVKREVAIMKRLDHGNVVRLKEVIDDVKSKKVFMGKQSLVPYVRHPFSYLPLPDCLQCSSSWLADRLPGKTTTSGLR